MHHKHTRLQQQGRGHSFIRFEHRLLRAAVFEALSGKACKALFFLAAQYTGSNNGDLGIAWKVARMKGWCSKDNLQQGVRELVDAGIVVQTRQGGRNRCSLYALAWFPINDCDGKLDVPATRIAPNTWTKLGNLSDPPAGQCAPPAGQSAQGPT